MVFSRWVKNPAHGAVFESCGSLSDPYPNRLSADKEKAINNQGLVTLLKQIHDEIDVAVVEAYQWQAKWHDRLGHDPLGR